MKRTKFQAFATLAVASLVLAGCGSSSGGSTDSSSTAADGTSSSAAAGPSGTIRLETVDTTDAIKQVIAAFEKQYPNVTVNMTAADADPYQQTLRTELASGTGPDVMSVWPGNGNPATVFVLGKAGYLEDLSSQSWASKLPSGIKSVSSYDGKVYAGLFDVNGIGAIYNDQAVAAAGLTPPTTWTELLQFCKDAKANGTPAFALGNHDGWVTQLITYALVATDVYPNSPDFDAQMAAGSATFSGSGWATALQQYMQMNDAGCFQKSPLGTTYDQTQALVATGKTLGLVQGNWVITNLVAKNPSATFTMQALPATDNASDTMMPAAPGAGYGVNASSQNKDAAIAFVNFVMSNDGMNMYTKAQGGVPVFSDTGYQLDPSLQVLSDYLSQNKTVPFPDQLWPNPTVQQDHLAGIQELFSGQTTIDKLLAKMDADYAKGSS